MIVGVEEALRRLHGKLAPAIAGVWAAAAAGMQCFAVPNRLTKQGDFSAATEIFGSVSEAVEFFLSRLN